MISDWIKSLTKPTKGVGPIGLQFAYEGINAVQFYTQVPGVVKIKDSVSIRYPKDFDLSNYSTKAFQQLIKQMFKSTSFSGHKINTTMPTRELSIISVNYQMKKGESEAAAVANVVAERIEGSLDEHIIDYYSVRTENKHENGVAIVALANKKKVLSYLECLRKSGLEVSSLEIGPSAIRRLISVMHSPTDNEIVLVLNFGSQTSFLSVMSGRRLLFDESIEFGEEMLLKQLQNALKLDKSMVKSQLEKHGLGKINQVELNHSPYLDQQVASTMEQILKPDLKKITYSIKRSAMYASSISHGIPFKKVYLLGSLARWRGADRILSELLDMEVTLIPNPLLSFGADAKNLGFSNNQIHHAGAKPELAVASGLALQGLLDHG